MFNSMHREKIFTLREKCFVFVIIITHYYNYAYYCYNNNSIYVFNSSNKCIIDNLK